MIFDVPENQIEHYLISKGLFNKHLEALTYNVYNIFCTFALQSYVK
jgi:hypothetical protein